MSLPAGQKPTPGAANSSSWNDSGYAFAPNTNVLDKDSMPSEKAEAARQKSAAVMAALKAGDSAEANRLVGDQQKTGPYNDMTPLGWVKKKLYGKKHAKAQEKVAGDGESTMSGSTLGVEQVKFVGKKDDGVIR